MPTILGANTLSSGYDVANSLRLNSGDSAQMNKTLGTATDVDKYTISMWVKRSRLAHRQMMMRVINGWEGVGGCLGFVCVIVLFSA